MTSRSIDVVAKKHDGGRGQAFIVFAEQTAATSALRSLTGETFYNKELVSGIATGSDRHSPGFLLSALMLDPFRWLLLSEPLLHISPAHRSNV